MFGSTIPRLLLHLILDALWLDFLENSCQVTFIREFPGVETAALRLPPRDKHSTLSIPLYQALVLWMLGYCEPPEAEFLPRQGTLESIYRKEKRSTKLQLVEDQTLLGAKLLIQMQDRKVMENGDNKYEKTILERLRTSYSQFINRRIRKIMEINHLNENNVKQANVMLEEKVLLHLINEVYRAWHQHLLEISSLDDLVKNITEKDQQQQLTGG